MKASRLLSVEEARRGLYIDLEGSRDNPALLGVLYQKEDGTDHFIQFILDEALHPAWVFDVASFPTGIKVAAEVVLQYVEEPEAPRCLFAWSEYEGDRLAELLAGNPLVRITEAISNARPLAARWRRLRFPDHPSATLPLGKRNALPVFLELVGYQRHPDNTAELKPAQGIGAMASALKRAGRVDQVSRETAAAWRATLLRNYDDCAGMRTVMTRIAENS